MKNSNPLLICAAEERECNYPIVKPSSCESVEQYSTIFVLLLLSTLNF